MTQEDKLGDATNNYCVNVRKGYPRVMDETDRYICNAFKAGAEWQKEQIIDKACEWLKCNFNMPDDFESHFKKAMEE